MGVHNACNALAAFAVADVLNLPVNKAIEALSEFDGVDRRWTESDGVCKIVRDYAHHPTEIECSLAAAKSVADGKVICLFQPHTYSRTQAFFDRFATCFRQADTVIYLPVYSARETPIDGINSFALAKRARELGVNAMYADSFDQAKNIALGIVRKNDLLLVVGAGISSVLPIVLLRFNGWERYAISPPHSEQTYAFFRRRTGRTVCGTWCIRSSY